MTQPTSSRSPDVTAPPPTALRHVVPVVAVVLGVHVLFVAVRLLALGGDITSFTDGYDGQAYYRLALRPADRRGHGRGHHLHPSGLLADPHRLPARGRGWSLGGQPALVPVALLLVNLLAVARPRLPGRAAWPASSDAARGGARSPALWAGYVVGVGQDLTEPLAGALLLGSLRAIRDAGSCPPRWRLTAAALTRETTLVVAVAVLLARCVPRGAPRAPPLVGRRRAPGRLRRVAHLGTRALVGRGPGPAHGQPARGAGHRAGGLPRPRRRRTSARSGPTWCCWSRPWPPSRSRRRRCGIAKAQLHERLALAGYLALLLCLPVWDRGQAYLRWGCEPVLLGWLLMLGRRSRELAALAVLCAVLWLVAATQSLGYPAWGGAWTWS